MDLEKLNQDDSLRESYPKINKAIESAGKAEGDASEAKTTANESKQQSHSTQTQLDNIVIEGDSSVEAAQARVDADGANYDTLKARLDSEHTEVTSQLAQTRSYEEELRKVSSANAPLPLAIPTYVNVDNHAVHPSTIWDNQSKYGYKWIMAFTPYSRSDDSTENPSIVVSSNGKDWRVPDGLTNPLAESSNPGTVHFSDTELIDNGTQLELWYRETDKSQNLSRLLRMTSTDCSNWSQSEVVFDYGTGGNGYGSPSVVMEESQYNLYYRKHMSLNVEAFVLRTSNDLNSSWSNEVEVTFDYGDMFQGYVGWHNEFRKFDGTYYALVNASKDSNLDDGKLFVFTSVDGINFSNCKLLIAPSENGFDSGWLYKASMVRWGSEWYIYYSAYSKFRAKYIGLTIGSTFDNLTGYSPNIEGEYNISGIDSILKRIQVRKPVTLRDRTAIVNDGVSSGYLGTINSSFIKSYRYENGENNGGFEGVGFKFDNYVGSDFSYPNQFLHYNTDTERLILRNRNVNAEIARMIHFTLTANGGKGVVDYYSGQDFVKSIESNSTGFVIELNHMPINITPSISIAYSGSTPPKNTNNEYAKDWYIRSRESSFINVGLKTDIIVSGHLAFNTLDSGGYDITILV